MFIIIFKQENIYLGIENNIEILQVNIRCVLVCLVRWVCTGMLMFPGFPDVLKLYCIVSCCIF